MIAPLQPPAAPYSPGSILSSGFCQTRGLTEDEWFALFMETRNERDEARAEVARLRLRLKDSDSIRHAEKEILIQEIAEVARLRKLLGRLQLCASALLGWHSETMNIEAVRKVAEVVCDAEMELKKAPKVTSATTHIMEERE